MKEMIKTIFESTVVNEALDIYIPHLLLRSNQEELEEVAIRVAEAFGIKQAFIGILKDDRKDEECVVIKKFARNVKLLIDKTWVNQGNEFLKFQTVKKIEKLSTLLSSSLENNEKICFEYFDEFCLLLKEIIYLLFGKEVGENDCLKYILHIEPNFGFFCYYVTQISNLKNKTEENTRLLLLIAIVFLSEF